MDLSLNKNTIKIKRHINLIPKYISVNKEREKQYNYSLLLLLVAFVCSLFLTLNQYSTSTKLKADKISKTKQIEELIFIENLENELIQIKAKTEKKKKFEENINKSNSNMLDIIALLERIMTNDFELSSLADSVNEKKEKTIIISGICRTNENVADFETALRNSGLFSTVFVPSITQAIKTDSSKIIDKPVKFTVNCVFKEEEETANKEVEKP